MLKRGTLCTSQRMLLGERWHSAFTSREQRGRAGHVLHWIAVWPCSPGPWLSPQEGGTLRALLSPHRRCPLGHAAPSWKLATALRSRGWPIGLSGGGVQPVWSSSRGGCRGRWFRAFTCSFLHASFFKDGTLLRTLGFHISGCEKEGQ